MALSRALVALAALIAACSSTPVDRPAEPRIDVLRATFERDAAGALVLFREGTPTARAVALVQAAGAEARYRFRTIPALYVRPGARALEPILEELRAAPEVLAVTHDRPLTAPSSAALLAPGASGGARDAVALLVQGAGAPAAWRRGASGRGVGIAIVDSGVRAGAGAALGDRCFSAYAVGGCDDPVGHGTLLALVAAAREDRRGLVGVAKDAVVYPVRVLDDALAGSDATLAAGLDWVADVSPVVVPPIQVAVVVAGRPGALDDGPALRAVLAALAARGITVVAGGDPDHVPGRYPEVVAASAADPASGLVHAAVTAGAVALARQTARDQGGVLDPAALRAALATPGLDVMRALGAIVAGKP